MIINSHVHVNTNRKCFFYNDYDLHRFLDEMFVNAVDIALPTLNPKLEIFRCPNDCSFTCPSLYGKINYNLDSCNCNSPQRHRVCVSEEEMKKLILYCRTCGKLILESNVDPLRKYNMDLINLTKPYRAFLKPILYLSLCKTTLQNEINFFEKKFVGEFVGFKFHPWNDQVSVADFEIRCSYPILIHTGPRNIENPINAITFAQNNPNVKVVIAHAAALDENCLQIISKSENMFIDCCPSIFMFESRSTFFSHPQSISKPEDIYYKVLSMVPSNKILFGTDSPWGNTSDELAVVRSLKVSEKVKKQILFENAQELYQL